MRAFLAFPVPSDIRVHVRELQEYLRQNGVRGKWTEPDNLHLTVLFLGDQGPEPLRLLSSTLESELAVHGSFSLAWGTLGTFGRPPRVLYLGWEGGATAQYAALANDVRSWATACGVVISPATLRQEPRPHLTLARFRSSRESRALAALRGRAHGVNGWPADVPAPPADAGSIVCERIHLVHSVLRPDGPEYHVLEEFPLTRQATV